MVEHGTEFWDRLSAQNRAWQTQSHCDLAPRYEAGHRSSFRRQTNGSCGVRPGFGDGTSLFFDRGLAATSKASRDVTPVYGSPAVVRNGMTGSCDGRSFVVPRRSTAGSEVRTHMAPRTWCGGAGVEGSLFRCRSFHPGAAPPRFSAQKNQLLLSERNATVRQGKSERLLQGDVQ